MQPTFIPWLGYFNMIAKCDSFVFFDDVQIIKRSWQTRNRIKTANGELYLTVPISRPHSRCNINECQVLHDNKAMAKNIRTLKNAYGKSAHYEQHIDYIEDLLRNKQTTLAEYNSQIIKKISCLLNIDTQFYKSSQLSSEGTKDEYLAAICKELGATGYLSAPGSKEYINEGVNYFNKNSIPVTYNEYKHPAYQQLYGPFMSHLSVVDALLNVGVENVKEMVHEMGV